MSNSRLTHVWFGILGITAGVAVLLSGVFVSANAQAADEGISITIVSTAPVK